VDTIVCGEGHEPIAALLDGINRTFGFDLRFVRCDEQTLTHGAAATAIAYVELQTADEAAAFGIGLDRDARAACLRAVVSAANRAVRSGAVRRHEVALR
jgi:2-isopropylmalate synthase